MSGQPPPPPHGIGDDGHVTEAPSYIPALHWRPADASANPPPTGPRSADLCQTAPGHFPLTILRLSDGRRSIQVNPTKEMAGGNWRAAVAAVTVTAAEAAD